MTILRAAVRAVCVAASAAALTPCGVLAQNAPQAEAARRGGLEEIVVTATRREENLLNVPISIAAYSQESLDQKGVRNIEDLARITPGLRGGTVEVECRGDGAGGTVARVVYDLVAFNAEGDADLAGWTEEWYRDYLAGWEREIAAFLLREAG